MNRWMILAVTIAAMVVALSCAGGSPTSPSAGEEHAPTLQAADRLHVGQTRLWGWYEVYVDVVDSEVVAVPNRHAMFTANVVNFINSSPVNMSFQINQIDVEPDYTDVDIDVSLTHPFPGLNQYDGYDVRGVFMGNGSASLITGGMIYPLPGTDQCMLPDPLGGNGGPDGYTRWFNFTEFSQGGMPLFQYTQGKLASPGFDGTATLCPYKYFADGLGKDEDLWTWLGANPAGHGVFTAGAMNTRNYYIRFPGYTGVKFGYAIVADWGGTDPASHPSNAPEAVACSVTDQSDVWYAAPADKGGSIKLDISLWDWDSIPSGDVMDDYTILVESTVLSNVHQFTTSEMTPIGIGEHCYTYRVEIPADNINGTQDQEFWVLAQCADVDYTNPYGVPNLAEADHLTAAFRYALTVGNQSNEKSIHVSIPNGGETWQVWSPYNIIWESVNVTGDVRIDYSMDGGGVWIAPALFPDTANDGAEEWTPKTADVTAQGRIKVSSVDDPSVFDVSDADFTVETPPIPDNGWVRTWGGSNLDGNPNDVAVDSAGNVYACGVFNGTVDFDPGPGVCSRTSSANDCFLNKLDANGNWVWTQTWGNGGSDDRAPFVAIDPDNDNYVYVTWQSSISTSYLRKLKATDGTDAAGWTPPTPVPGYSTGLAVDSSGVYMSVGYTSKIYRYPVTGGAPTWSVSPTYSAIAVSLNDWSNSLTVEGSTLWAVGTVYMGGGGGGGCTWVGGFDSSTGAPQTPYVFGVLSGGNTGSATGTGIEADGTYLYVTGAFIGTNVTLAPFGDVPHDSLEPASTYHMDPFITKFNASTGYLASGTWPVIWTAPTPELKGYDNPYAIGLDSANNVYVTGRFRSLAIMFGTAIGYKNKDQNADPAARTADAFLAKVNSSGTWVWAHAFGGVDPGGIWIAGWDIGFGLCVRAGNVYTTGYFENTVDFTPPPGTGGVRTSNGAEDVWVTKHKLDGSW